ncbi:flagellar hook-length control protein FliK [Oxalobacteraceae bacterium CAVE-383]|nr:flagellar hook-length control protein FliK [Oxalobacteraceae bacterium CAVE-383]
MNQLDQFAIGQQIQAKVVSLFQDGSALVRMGETAARMVLPANARPGSNVLLTLTSKDPRPTFSMVVESEGDPDGAEAGARPLGYNAAGNPSGGASLAQSELGIGGAAQRGAGIAGAAANNAAGAAQGANAQAGGPALPQSANLTLSSAGQMISNLLQAQPQGPAATIVSHAAPLSGPPTMPTREIAAALHDSVALSGVFYESHVTEWVDGKRNLADLQREPQAQIGKSADNAGLLTRADAASTEIGKIVNAQLSTLDQPRITWQGEIWPGQRMEWEISRDDSERQQPRDDGSEPPPTWQSVVRFNFEHLGPVSASIRLIGDQIHMQLRTSNDGANEALRLHGSELADSMAAAGSSLDSLIVKREGPG